VLEENSSPEKVTLLSIEEETQALDSE